MACQFRIPDDKARLGLVAKQLQVVSQTESSLRMILDMLRRSSSAESAELLNRIREAPSINSFADTLADANLLVSYVPPSMGLHNTSAEVLHNRPPRGLAELSRGLGTLEITGDFVAAFPSGVLPLSQWTTLSTDDKYLTHLLNLFFTWDNTLSHIIPQTRLLQDLKSGASKSSNLCSRFLIHSIFAIAHLYMSQGTSHHQCQELRSRARKFADEALHMLDDERQHPSISFLQGLVTLWAYEVNYGEKAQAEILLNEFYTSHDTLGLGEFQSIKHAAFSSQKSHELKDEQIVSFIIWGFFCLDAKLSLAFSRTMRLAKPKIARTFEDTYTSIFANPTASEYLWFPYPSPSQAQPSLFRDVFSLECQFAELVLEASQFFEVSTVRPDCDEPRSIYERVLRWGVDLQPLLANRVLLPSVLFLDVTHEMVLVRLLSYLSRTSSQDGSPEAAMSTLVSYGDSIISHVWVYRATYGMRHEYWLMQACFLAVKTVVLNIGEKSSLSKTIVMAFQLLYAMGDVIPAAIECLLAIKLLSHQQSIDLPRPCKMILARSAVRTGKILVKGVRMIVLEPGTSDARGDPLANLLYNVTFSEVIERVSNDADMLH